MSTMLSFDEKREILRSFLELREVSISNGRCNYELLNVVTRKRVVAREFAPTGNGYVLGTPDSIYPVDERGWVNIKNLDEIQLRKTIRQAIMALKTTDFRHRYAALLKDSGLLPLTSGVWQHFTLKHQPPTDPGETEQTRKVIDHQVDDANGLYVYTQQDGTVLYVGKAKPLKNRMWSHYLESFQTVKGGTKDNRWHRFFSSHQGTVIVYWAEIEDEEVRKILERMLTLELMPLFIDFH